MTDSTSPQPGLAPAERQALVSERLELVAELLARHDADGVLLPARRDFAWLTAGGLNHVVLASETGVAPLLVTRDGAGYVLAPVNEAPRIAEEELAGLPLSVEEVPWFDASATQRRARDHIAGRLLDAGEVEADMTALRERLTGAEHDRLEWLGSLVRRVVDEALAATDEGTTERALEAGALSGIAEAGGRCPVVLVAADERIDRYRHPLPTERRVSRRVMLVVVAERWGLHAALTGVRELTAPTADLAQRSEAVHDVLAAMRDATRPGRTLGDVLAAARERYAALGYGDEWQLHHQGGTIGYQGRERIAVPDDASVILPGMAFAWNPSIRGTKAEETFYLDAGGRPHLVTG
jgi:Xaa-Pro dipeptidase